MNLDWRYDAACRGMDVELFFPVGKVPVDPAAKAACASCPVRPECHADAERLREGYGYRGGVDREDLRARRGGRRRPRTEVAA